MRTLLETSQRIAGFYDLLTINCLAMNARAYSEAGDYRNALRYATDAVHRCEVKYRDHIPYYTFRLKLIHNIALLQQRVQNFSEAERCLRQVLDGRLHVFGINNRYTWGSATALMDFLTSQNRHPEAQELYTGMEILQLRDVAERKAFNPLVAEDDASRAANDLREHLSFHNRDEAHAFIDGRTPLSVGTFDFFLSLG